MKAGRSSSTTSTSPGRSRCASLAEAAGKARPVARPPASAPPRSSSPPCGPAGEASGAGACSAWPQAAKPSSTRSCSRPTARSRRRPTSAGCSSAATSRFTSAGSNSKTQPSSSSAPAARRSASSNTALSTAPAFASSSTRSSLSGVKVPTAARSSLPARLACRGVDCGGAADWRSRSSRAQGDCCDHQASGLSIHARHAAGSCTSTRDSKAYGNWTRCRSICARAAGSSHAHGRCSPPFRSRIASTSSAVFLSRKLRREGWGSVVLSPTGPCCSSSAARSFTRSIGYQRPAWTRRTAPWSASASSTRRRSRRTESRRRSAARTCSASLSVFDDARRQAGSMPRPKQRFPKRARSQAKRKPAGVRAAIAWRPCRFTRLVSSHGPTDCRSNQP